MLQVILSSTSRLLHLAAATPMACRFEPSCSKYCAEAVHKHGVFLGAYLSLKRLLRCHPWGASGYDPVPSAQERKE